jgi:hypothetical protein
MTKGSRRPYRYWSGNPWYAVSRLSELAKAHGRRLLHRRQVSIVNLRGGLRSARHVVVMVVHNEADRLGYLLHYYRTMGFDHFLVLDNDSDDGTVDLLADQQDVSVFRANGSYKAARFGNDWINHVLSRYASGRWVLYVDADEFLVFPQQGSVPIMALTEQLEAGGREVLHTVMLDMYSDRPLIENAYQPGTDPLAVCPLYDAVGYSVRFEEASQTTWIKGGIRSRLFFSTDPSKAPALNKTPLVRWRRHFAFTKSAHQLTPSRLNGPGRQHVPPADAVLLHFKFLSSFRDRVAQESVRRQHTAEYAAYGELDSVGFVSEATRQFEGWQSVVETGLLRAPTMSPAQQAETPVARIKASSARWSTRLTGGGHRGS